MSRRRRNHKSTEPSPFWGLYTGFAKLVVTLGIVVALAEWGAGLALKKIRDEHPRNIPSYTDEQIALLYDTAQPKLVREVLLETYRRSDIVYQPFVEYGLVPHEGKGFTIRAGGFRANGPGVEPASAGARIFVFGGSTTLGTGVADGETLPAQLEQVLRDAGKGVTVFNFGAPGRYSTPSRVVLESMLTSGNKPDLAIFVDGLEDFAWCGVPDESALSSRLARTSSGRAIGASLVERSNVLKLIRRLAGGGPEDVFATARPCANAAEIDAAITRLDANRRMIAGAAERLGVKVLFVQQPVPTYHYDQTKRAVKLDVPATYAASGPAYARMAELKAEGKLADSLWLDALEPAEGNAYVDGVHYSPRFNRAIGEVLARHLVETGLLP